MIFLGLGIVKEILQYCCQAILCINIIARKIIIKKSSYDIFLTLLLFLFGFNPLVSQSLYYTAESIFEEIKAIKGFIYPYLEQTP